MLRELRKLLQFVSCVELRELFELLSVALYYSSDCGSGLSEKVKS